MFDVRDTFELGAVRGKAGTGQKEEKEEEASSRWGGK